MKKKVKLFRSEIQDSRHGGHLENLYGTSSPQPKGQLTQNYIGSIEATYRSEIGK